MAYTAIDDSEAYFQCKLYTGDGSGAAHTFDGDTDLAPGLLWIKSRSASNSSHIVDSVRTYNKALSSDDGGAEFTSKLASLDSDGFTTSEGSFGAVSTDGRTFAVWCWNESATAGFDIVSYTGDGSARDISHSLSAVPHFIIIKNRSSGDSWVVGHHQLGDGDWNDSLRLEEADAINDETTFNDTTPTSSVFSVDGSNNVNRDTSNFIAYVFTEKQGFSKFGSYVGNGNADGTFVYTGFKPAWVLVKRDTSGWNWILWNNKVDGYNIVNDYIQPNLSGAEVTDNAAQAVDFLSNGFKHRGTGDSSNASGVVHYYMAFAEAPFVNSNGVPCNAR